MRFALILLLLLGSAPTLWAAERPNIVWLVLDDAGPNLGAYGDQYAHTPQMDRLAREGVRFDRAFTHAPVCAPSRSGLITGQYPTTIGSHHMRSQLLAPPETFTAYLRRAGYYVIWPGKTDFNFVELAEAIGGGRSTTNQAPPGAFDSRQDWTRQPPKQRPFFAYFNLSQTHESQIRLAPDQFAAATARLKPGERHDPARVTVPAYYPDAPEVRQDLARYYDLMTAADYRIGEILAKLDEWQLTENTIVFLFSDHGRGMPRAKRWLYDSGIRVPLLIRWPGHLQAGSVRTDLVSFIDFAPTVLALAGAPRPAYLQGQNFLGAKRQARTYVYAARDRMDETFDRIRAVRDQRFKYIRNFHPELPYTQRIAYNEENPTMQAWRRLHAAGQLTGAARFFFAPVKPAEELYDTATDPDEVNNLANDPRYRATLNRMRAALTRWMRETKDLGAVSEQELIKRGLVKNVLEEYEKRKTP